MDSCWCDRVYKCVFCITDSHGVRHGHIRAARAFGNRILAFRGKFFLRDLRLGELGPAHLRPDRRRDLREREPASEGASSNVRLESAKKRAGLANTVET